MNRTFSQEKNRILDDVIARRRSVRALTSEAPPFPDNDYVSSPTQYLPSPLAVGVGVVPCSSSSCRHGQKSSEYREWVPPRFQTAFPGCAECRCGSPAGRRFFLE